MVLPATKPHHLTARLFVLPPCGLLPGRFTRCRCPAARRWRVKYRELFWRPITALRTPHTAGGKPSVNDPTWTPLLATPAHPEYPSGHQTTSGTENYTGTVPVGPAARLFIASSELQHTVCVPTVC